MRRFRGTRRAAIQDILNCGDIILPHACPSVPDALCIQVPDHQTRIVWSHRIKKRNFGTQNSELQIRVSRLGRLRPSYAFTFRPKYDRRRPHVNWAWKPPVHAFGFHNLRLVVWYTSRWCHQRISCLSPKRRNIASLFHLASSAFSWKWIVARTWSALYQYIRNKVWRSKSAARADRETLITRIKHMLPYMLSPAWDCHPTILLDTSSTHTHRKKKIETERKPLTSNRYTIDTHAQFGFHYNQVTFTVPLNCVCSHGMRVCVTCNEIDDPHTHSM
jgi:hypothetical protein